MAKLSLSLPRQVKTWRWLAVALGLVVTLVGVWAYLLPAQKTPAHCDGGVCQCCYCEDRPNGECYVDGHPSGCIGCAGACAYNDAEPQLPGTCSDGGRGGCGAYVIWCRSSDCGVRDGGPPAPISTVPPRPTPRPTPIPDPNNCPALGETREWFNLIPPKIGKPQYQPDHPTVIGQDPNKTGFTMHMVFDGGRYEHKTQRLEQWCGPASAGESLGRYGTDCTGDVEWHWECPIRCPECYDDPLSSAQIHMRLADPTLDWIQQELAARYPGAAPKEGLPRTWQIIGVANQMHYDAWWRYAPGQPDYLSNGPIDPGIHGGRIVVTTKGTPKSAPQVVQSPFEVPVYLVETTITQ